MAPSFTAAKDAPATKRQRRVRTVDGEAANPRPLHPLKHDNADTSEPKKRRRFIQV
jgi:hypothetical protein